jgi:hypothetical protein
VCPARNFPAGFFCWKETQVRAAAPEGARRRRRKTGDPAGSCMAASCARSSARRRRRSSSPRATSTTAPSRPRRASRARTRLHLFALRQPDRRHVRGAHAPLLRRRRSRARDRHRHGRGDARADGPGQGRRPRRRGEGAVRLLPLRRRGRCCRASASPRRWSTAPTSTHGARRCARTPSLLPRKPDQPDAGSDRHRRRSPRSRTRPARTLVVDNVFATPLCSRARSNSAPTASSIPPPSTSTARAAASAASSWDEEFIETTSTPSCARPARRCRPFNAWVLLKGLETLPCASPADRQTPPSVADASPSHPKVTRLIYPGRADHPQAELASADEGRLDAGRLRGQGRQEGAFAFQRAQARAHLQQSRRRQEPDHPSLDHHPPAADPRQRAELGITDGGLRGNGRRGQNHGQRCERGQGAQSAGTSKGARAGASEPWLSIPAPAAVARNSSIARHRTRLYAGRAVPAHARPHGGRD